MELDASILAQIETPEQAEAAYQLLQQLADAVHRSPGGVGLAMRTMRSLTDEELRAVIEIYRDAKRDEMTMLDESHAGVRAAARAAGASGADVVQRLLPTAEGRAALSSIRDAVPELPMPASAGTERGAQTNTHDT